MGTFWVGATFQLGPGGLPSTSLASKWLRRSLVALGITYLPHMSLFCLVVRSPGSSASHRDAIGLRRGAPAHGEAPFPKPGGGGPEAGAGRGAAVGMF